MRLRKTKTVQIESLNIDGEVLFDLKNLNQLKKFSNKIYETDNAFYGVTDSGIQRVKKPNFKPAIYKVKTLILETGQTQIYVDYETLVELADKFGTPIWETDSYFLILGSGTAFYAEKKGKRR